jgi:hypothetical protein
LSEESERTEQAVMEIMRKEFGKQRSPARNVLILALTLGIAFGIATARLLLWHWSY